MKRVRTQVSPDPEDCESLQQAIRDFNGAGYTPCGRQLYDKETPKRKRRLMDEQPTKAEQREFRHEVEDLGRGPLGGLSYACSGVFEDITREKLELFIKCNDGKLASSVSGKTDFLIVGKLLDDNRPVTESGKYKAAQRFGTKIVTEKEFELYCRDKFENPDFRLGRKTKKDTTEQAADHFVGEDQYQGKAGIDEIGDISELLDRTPPKQSPALSAFRKQSPSQPQRLAQTPQTKPSSKPATPSDYWSSANNKPVPTPRSKPQNESHELWVDRYAPRQVRDLIGNKGPINEVKSWLQDWYAIQSGQRDKKELKKMRSGQKPFNDPNARSLLIFGPPGVGKTTTVRLLANQLNFDVMELNASDTRNKAQIEAMLTDLSQLSFGIKSALSHTREIDLDSLNPVKKSLIVMDEVDGVGGGDRGGLSALLLIVKKTKVPIILIANDRQDRRIQTLANHSYEVKFSSPKAQDVMPRLRVIGQSEDFTPELSEIDPLFEAAGRDIRALLNMLQLRFSTPKRALDCSKVGKDQVQMLDNFQGAKLLLSGEKMPLKKRQDIYFLDFQLMPLFVQQSYLDCCRDIVQAAQAADYISLGDMISADIKCVKWGLLPEVGLMGSTAPTMIISKPIGNLWVKFPEIWPKGSVTKKTNRMLKELKASCGSSFQADQQSFLMQYVPLLFNLVIQKLQLGTKSDIIEAAEILLSQGVTIDLFKDNVLTLLMDCSGEQFANLSSQVKTAFTKTYNQLQQSCIKRVKKDKRKQQDEDGDYKQGFDPTYMDDFEKSDDSNDSQEEFEAVGKTKEVKAPKRNSGGQATQAMRGRGSRGGRGRGQRGK